MSVYKHAVHMKELGIYIDIQDIVWLAVINTCKLTSNKIEKMIYLILTVATYECASIIYLHESSHLTDASSK